jgi:pilus assembly protein CpaC
LIDQQTITVPVNKSRILDLREPIARVSVANPAIADILVINPKQIYLNGKGTGRHQYDPLGRQGPG